MYLKFPLALITYHKSKLSHATRIFLKSVIQYILYFFFILQDALDKSHHYFIDL